MADKTYSGYDLFPEQLERIAVILRGLNAIDKQIAEMDRENKPITNLGIQFGGRIEIVDEEYESLIGYAIDEIGGAWSFQPASNEEYVEFQRKLREHRS